jgi:hypothetical protein
MREYRFTEPIMSDTCLIIVIGAMKYVYALGTRPLARNCGSWEYLLPDALGSVRQIVDANGNVTLAKSYEPYSSVLKRVSTASSIFSYCGEQMA